MTKWKDETILSLVFLLLLAENCLAGSDDDTQIPHETGNVPLIDDTDATLPETKKEVYIQNRIGLNVPAESHSIEDGERDILDELCKFYNYHN
ncbi:hypothetical protein RUM44_006291 [Polyplax serrata]|uniref:Uncharacterized protein n=1 Tax=Polyplax serrata TaxID=468196 RepID=A0ABR1AHQ6_POLSC